MDTNLKRRISWSALLLSVVVSAGIVLIPRQMMISVLATTDDHSMARIMSGCMSGVPDGHAVFIQYPLTWIMARLYQFWQGIDWYLVTMLAVYVISIAAILYRLYQKFPGKRGFLSLGFTAVFYSLWLVRLCNLTFTTVGAFVAASLILVYALQPRELDNRPANLALTLLLFFFAYTVRIVFAGMALPFLAVIWLWKYGKQLFRRSSWVVPLCAALCAGAMFGINTLAYSSPEWQSYLTYNDQRSYLEDFKHFPKYEKHQAFFDSLGLTEAEYTAIKKWDYTMIPGFSPKTEEKIYHYAVSLEKKKPLTNKLRKSLRRAIEAYLNLDSINLLVVLSILLPAGLLLTAVVIAAKEKAPAKLALPLLNLTCEGILWLYIGYCNRMPTRVMVSLRLVTSVAALAGLGMLLSEKKWIWQLPRKMGRCAGCLLFAFLLCVGSASVYGVWKQQQNEVPNGHDDFCAYVAEHPENIYIIDTRSATRNLKQVYIPTNLFYTGGWTLYSPVYQQRLEINGIDHIDRNVLLQNNAYLVIDKKRSIQSALGISEETEVKAEEVDRFDRLQVFRIDSVAGEAGA